MSTIKRDRLDIMISVLEAAKEQTKKTHILYRTNINYHQLMKYLTLLEELGMITSINGEYLITDKGRIFLDLLSNSLLLKH